MAFNWVINVEVDASNSDIGTILIQETNNNFQRSVVINLTSDVQLKMLKEEMTELLSEHIKANELRDSYKSKLVTLFAGD